MEVDSSVRHLRNLDVDDLIVMRLLLDKVPCASIAKTLGLTAPAISHRRKKYAEIFEGFYEPGMPARPRTLSASGAETCKKMSDALDLLLA